MDLAEGRPVFKGRGQKPSNKSVLTAIESINKCQQARLRGSFFSTDKKEKPCSCGWHTKAAARKQSKLKQAQAAVPVTSVSDPSVSSVLSSPSTMSVASTSTAITSSNLPKPPGSGPVPLKFDRSNFQSPTIGELRSIRIGLKTSPGKLDLVVYCPLGGRCPHCKSSIISANSVGKRKLCYAIPWPRTIVGVDMRCGKCNKHFMTHNPSYVDTLPSEDQVKREFVTGKGNATDISLIRMLRSGLTVAQVERYIEDEVRQHYLRLKSEYLELWDKVHVY